MRRGRDLKKDGFEKYTLKRNITLEIAKNNDEKLAYDIYLLCQCSILSPYCFSSPSLINKAIFEIIHNVSKAVLELFQKWYNNEEGGRRTIQGNIGNIGALTLQLNII